MRLPLVDGQGNFGSIDGDPPAAMRYTEARLALAADGCSPTSTRRPSTSGRTTTTSTREPTVLPAQFPNLLVNGAGGIAVGMATNIPPHNLGEVIDACLRADRRPRARLRAPARARCPGPDFPTGGIILGRRGIRQAYHTGRGSLVLRGSTHIEEIRKDRDAIIVTEIPYQVNKARMIESIGELVRERRLEGIADLRDESRPRRHAGRDRAQARRRPRHRAQPAVPPHAAADQLRRQPGGARRRPAGAAQPAWRCCAPSSSSARR